MFPTRRHVLRPSAAYFPLLAVLALFVSNLHDAWAFTRTWDGGPSGTGTDMSAAANWSSDTAPTTNDEALFSTVPSTATTFSTGNSNLTWGDLVWNNNTSSSLTNSTGNRTITLSGGGGSTAAVAAGGASGDLIVLGTNATTNNLTVGSSTVSIVLGTSGNFDVVNSGATLTIGGTLSGASRDLTKTGAGTLTFTRASTYTGQTMISGGTFRVDNNGTTTTGRIGNSSKITVSSGGTLLLSGSNSVTDRISDAASMTLAGGTFNLGGLSEGAAGAATFGLGALSLTSTSTINFGTTGTSNLIEFNGLGTQTNGQILQITNWEGTINQPNGTDRLLFVGNSTDFTTLYSQSEVSFNGLGGYGITQFTGFYEVYEVPEPSTWFAAGLALLAIGYTQRRKLVPALKRFRT